MLVIRRLCVDDISESYISALQNPEIFQLTEARHTVWNLESVKNYVQEHEESNIQILFGIFLKRSRNHIGNIRIFNRDFNHKRCELSIAIFDQNSRGRGYGTMAINYATKFAFQEWNIHRVMADYYEINTASSRAFRKAGFKYEGTFKDHFLLPSGVYVDSIRVAKLNIEE